MAWFFLLYGHWDFSEEPVEIREGEVVYFEFLAEKGKGEPDLGFAAVGYLSQMISMQYREIISLKKPRAMPFLITFATRSTSTAAIPCSPTVFAPSRCSLTWWQR